MYFLVTDCSIHNLATGLRELEIGGVVKKICAKELARRFDSRCAGAETKELGIGLTRKNE